MQNLSDLDGIGETQIDSINNFFQNGKNIKIVKNLIDQLNVAKFVIINRRGKFSDKKIMFTGGFQNMSRSEAKSIAENNGGKVLGSISRKLDFLVVGKSKPTKKKLEQAKNLGIKLLMKMNGKKS